MNEIDYEKLDYLRRKAKLNVLNYIKIKLIQNGKKELPKEYSSIDEYEYNIRLNALRLKYCGDYLNDKADCGIFKYTEDKMNKDLERIKQLKLTK